MLAATERFEFAPPPPPGLLRAAALAVVVHGFLLVALTWGVHWKREASTLSVEAELWSALPQAAAPPPELAAPLPPDPPATLAPAPPEAPPLAVDIALEQEKLRKQKELERAVQQQKLKQEQQLAEKKRLHDKQEKERKAAEEKKRAEQEKQRREALQAQREAKRIEEDRNRNLQRMAGLAGTSGNVSSTGSALQSSGPSPGYGGRISARIKPNIVFTDSIAGNPVAEVDVKLAPNGTILSRQLRKSSGVKSWDEAVLKAIDKTEKLPPDTDGRVPASLTIGFRPKD